VPFPPDLPRILAHDHVHARRRLPSDSWTIVRPGPPTTCIDGSEYVFQVMAGDPRRLLVYFQGGGACWNPKTTTASATCFHKVAFQPNTGVFDRQNASNPYRNHTVVMVNYCSGDMFMGNITQGYMFEGTASNATQRGFVNANAAIQWAKSRFGFVDAHLDRLTLMGCSAGSVGMQIWAQHLLAVFPASSREVVLDSYVGVFPPGSQGHILKNFKACEVQFLSKKVRTLCRHGTVTIQDVVLEVISSPEFADVRWVYINAKTDQVQQDFYKLIAVSGPGNWWDLIPFGPRRYYMLVNEVLLRYRQAAKLDFQVFLVDGGYHCYTCFSDWGASPMEGGPAWAGPLGHERQSRPELEAWLGGGHTTGSVCAGPTLAPNRTPSFFTNNSYCQVTNRPREHVSFYM